MALLKPSQVLPPAENFTRIGSAFNAVDALAGQFPFAQQAIAALLDAVASHGTALTELQGNDGALDVLIGSLENLTDAQGKAITAEQSRAATAEALARIIAAPKYSVPLDTITLPNGGAVYWNGSTSTGAGETSGGLRVPQGQTGIFSQHRTRFQPTAAQRTKFAGRPVQFMVAFRSTVGALTALRDSAGFSTLGGVIEGVPTIVGVKIYSIRPDLWLAVGDAVLTGNESVITIALQVSGNTIPVAADVSFVAIGALFMPVDATGTTDVLADLMQPLALRADNLIAAARVRYAPLLGAAPGVTDRVLVIPAGQSGAGSLAIYGAPVAGLQAGTRVRCRFAIQVAGGAFVTGGVAQANPPVTLIELFGATVEMTDGSQVGAVADLKATSPTTYEASVTFTATGAERIAEFYLKVDENSAVRLTEGQIRVGQMFVDVLSTEPTTTVAAQTARLTESFRAFIAAAPDRFRDWCSASSLSDGDYGTIREAVAAMRTGGSQDQPNRVVVLPGTYTNECATGVSINPADYVEIVGKGARRDVEIIARLPDNQAAQDSQQPILLTRSGRLSGLTVRGRNVKYPGHLEAGNAPVAAIWDIDDCEFVHEGATVWTETSALGVGQNDGSRLTATGSTFLSPTSGVGIHNNTAWARGARAAFTGCNLIGTGDSATSLAVTSQGAGVMSTVNLRGCVLSGRIHHYVSFLPGTPLSAYRGAPWEYTVRITDSDPVDWLSPCPFDVLTLTSVAAGNSAAAVGNTGAVRLFGRRPDVRAGAADYAARLHSSHLVSVPDGQFDPGVGLGARLGDMRGAAARPLDIFWDGSSTPVTISLDQNYAGMTNAQVLANLNGKLSAAMGGNTGGRAFSLSQPYHNRAPIRQPDREATAVNAGTATILKGHVLAKVGRRVRLMTATDAASAFAGIALDDAVPGRSVRFLKTGLIGQAHLLFDGDQTFTAGARYQISAANPGRLVPGTDLPVLSVRSVEAYGAALEIIGTVAYTGGSTVQAVRDAFAAITYQDVPGLPAVIDTVVPKGAVGAEPVTVGGVTDTVANRLGALQSGQSAGSVAYDTLAQLNANLTPTDGATAQVTADGANNGFYAKTGASGAGSWVRKSTATVPGLDALTAFVRQVLVSTDDGAFSLTDLAGNIGMRFDGANGLQAALAQVVRLVSSVSASSRFEVPGAFNLTANTADGALLVTDPEGNAALRLDGAALTVFNLIAKGALSAGSLNFGGCSLSAYPDPNVAFLVSDTNGWVLLALLADGTLIVPKVKTGIVGSDGDYSDDYIAERSARALALSAGYRGLLDTTSAAVIWNYNHAIGYGQSLFAGQEAWPAKTLAGRPDVLMLGQSVRPGSGNTSTAPAPLGDSALRPAVATVQRKVDGSLVDATAQAALPAGDDALGEDAGLVAMLFARRLFLQRLGQTSADDRRFVVGNVAVSGRSVEQLSKGASPELFNRLRAIASATKAAAQAAGGSYGVSALFYGQGEDNYGGVSGSSDKSTYKANLKKLYDDFVADVCVGIAGQDEKPAIITFQTNGTFTVDSTDLSIGQAQWELSLENPSWYLATPSYPATDKGGHLDPNGSLWVSLQMGKVFFETVIMRRRWRPTHMTQATVRGRTVLIDYHLPSGTPLQFKHVYVGSTPTMYTDKGFTLIDDVGTIPLVSVTLPGDAVVQIVLSRAPVGTLNIYYGRRTPFIGGGNLCDSDPTISPFARTYSAGSGDYPAANLTDPAMPFQVGKPDPLWNWAIAQKITATAN
ncbi:hypothetical protein ACSD7O_19540 [Methylorubrum extorquens]|uniref:hypothetical protein n=1 Tax=Methylorubrum extorquens TaxID=408 RepID=UPI003F5EE113